MLRLLMLAGFILPLVSWADAGLMRLSSDQSRYAAGGSATLTAVAVTLPVNSADEYFMSASLNGAPTSLTQSTNGFAIASVGPLVLGLTTWSVQLYLEDAVYAGQLNSTIQSLTLQNAHISTQLSSTTDPVQVAALQAEVSQNNALIGEASRELANIRRPLGAPESLSFLVD